MIRFLLDKRLIELDDVAADLTVLDWLRIHQQRTGTKEGCGSGDCGACTVVTASVVQSELASPQLSYQSLNSCITFIGALHGKQLLTVESLADQQALHPVQQSMVEEHGSQCGFCTPGFVMSMYALYQQNETADALTGRIDQALGGNLCRCTGYRPIKRAAEKVLQARVESRAEQQAQDAAIIEILQGLSSEAATTLSSVTREHLPAQQDKLDPVQAVRSIPISSPSAQQGSAARDSSQHLNPQDSEQAGVSGNSLRTPKQADVNGFFQPDKLQVLASFYLQHPEARLLAGGTDVALEVTQQMKDLPLLLSVNAVAELKVKEVTDTHLLIGSAVTLTDCMELMRTCIPGAHELLLRFGSDQVRNQGTIGGNIGSASPIGDLPPLLIALDAVLILQKGDDVREIPLEEHYLGYKKTTLQSGEFIKAVRLARPLRSSIFAVHKVSKRTDDDISSVCMAIHLQHRDGKLDNCRLAFGGMAATPIRARQAEQQLNGSLFDQASVVVAQQALSDELKPISDARASADYRLQVARNLLQRVLLENNERREELAT